MTGSQNTGTVAEKPVKEIQNDVAVSMPLRRGMMNGRSTLLHSCFCSHGVSWQQCSGDKHSSDASWWTCSQLSQWAQHNRCPPATMGKSAKINTGYLRRARQLLITFVEFNHFGTFGQDGLLNACPNQKWRTVMAFARRKE